MGASKFHSTLISLYSDRVRSTYHDMKICLLDILSVYHYIAIQRYLPYCVWHSFPHDEIDISVIARNSDCPQNPAMPLPRPIETNASSANLAQRLLQAACIILCSLLRLITSDNDTASIMESMCVSIIPQSLAIMFTLSLCIIGCAVTLVSHHW